MSDPRNGGVKTLGIKVPDSLHAQFALVAQLDGISLGDAALRAVELYVSTKKAEPDFAARAAAALEEIEREAAARRGAIQGLFGQDSPAPADTTERRGRRQSGEKSD
jgi:predicted component of type VI protein secretion system